MSISWKGESLSQKASLAGTVLALVSLVGFVIYGAIYTVYFDLGVIILLLAGAVCSAAYVALKGVSADTTYTIRAEALWDETIVTNASFDAELGSVTTSSAMNVTSDSYTYCNDDIYSYLDYPMVGESFDPEEGGIAGSWYKEETSGFGGVTPAAYIYYTAVPTDTADGSLYSYDVTIAKEEGTIDVSKDWYSGTDLDPLTGSLEIYEDGTFTMSIDLFYLGEHAESGMTAYVYATEIDGKWTDNGDGTITLAYDHSSVEITDTGDED